MSVKTQDELSYDQKTKTLRFGELSFSGVDKVQAAAIKCLYDLPEDCDGIYGEDVMKAIGRPNNRFQNLFQRRDRAILKVLVDYDYRTKFYSLKFPRNKSHQH